MIVSPDSSAPITADQWAALRTRWLNYEQLAAAWRLACDVGTLDDLLAGRPVDPSRLDQDELAKAQRATLVRLVAPVDLLEGIA